MNPNMAVTFVAAVCIIVSGALILGHDDREEAPIETTSDNEVVRWPSVDEGGTLMMDSFGNGSVTFTAKSLNSAKWTFQYWLGPEGLIDSSDSKTFSYGETEAWRAVFTEVA